MHLTHSSESTQPVSDIGRLSESLDSQRNDIINDWLDLVQKVPSNPTSSSNMDQVRDHLPHLFDELTETLHQYGNVIAEDISEMDDCDYNTPGWQHGL